VFKGLVLGTYDFVLGLECPGLGLGTYDIVLGLECPGLGLGTYDIVLGLECPGLGLDFQILALTTLLEFLNSQPILLF